MRVIFMYHEKEPQRGTVIPGNLPNPTTAFKGYRSLFLMQKPHQPDAAGSSSSSTSTSNDPHMKIMELRNQDVELPQGDDTLYWCKMFKLKDIDQKSHVVKVIWFWIKVYTYLKYHIFNSTSQYLIRRPVCRTCNILFCMNVKRLHPN